MTIEELKRRIVTNTRLALVSNRFESYKYSCEVVTDAARLCVKKIEQFVKEGTTKERYNEVVQAWHDNIEYAKKLVETMPRDSKCREATTIMAVRLTMLADDLRGLPEQIPFHDVSPAKENGEQEIKQEKVDAILDKISAQGIGSLTQQERDILSNFKS